ncbi:MAG: YihY/virulence factor BrkB family protein [Herpetosiphonaceae bacterium]|nr:YihY/virulence factor BrkB family protein [Herpetosiphonaceae bacterium]
MIAWIKSTAIPLLQRTFKAWTSDDCSRMAASLAYYAVFSIFPLILLLVSILGYWLRFRGEDTGEITKQLLASIESNVSGDISDALAQILTDIKLEAGTSAPVALATTLMAASGIFVQLDKSFDTIWNVPPVEGNFLHTIKQTLFDRSKAFVLVLSIGGLLIASLVVSTVLSGIGKYAENLPAGVFGWRLVMLGVAFLLNALVFALLFYAMPKPKMRWRDVLPAALITALLWEIGKQLLSEFLGGNKYTASATISAFIALLAWIYYASLIIFFGAEFAQVYTHWSADRRAAEQPLVALPPPPELPSVLLPDPQATAVQKSSYAVAGAMVGVVSTLLLAVGGVVLGLINLLRKRT